MWKDFKMKGILLISPEPWPWDKDTHAILLRQGKKWKMTKQQQLVLVGFCGLLNHFKIGCYFPAYAVLIYPTSSFPENDVRVNS